MASDCSVSTKVPQLYRRCQKEFMRVPLNVVSQADCAVDCDGRFVEFMVNYSVGSSGYTR
ncbi:hypothetical protein HanHA300_Chr09g0329541 [Helianthus annuus]|nr:hypothetical protein HanHA300_Chr09g0329541 [Helianthus annuus]KAJ0543414.1 hypothetical protein HanHA89_Chr09g0350431 [Helianthus annuus]